MILFLNIAITIEIDNGYCDRLHLNQILLNSTMAPNHPFLNCGTAKGDRLAIIFTPPKIFSSEEFTMRF